MATGHGKIDPKFDNFLRSPLFNYFSLRLTVRVQYYCQSVFGKFPMPFFSLAPKRVRRVFLLSCTLSWRNCWIHWNKSRDSTVVGPMMDNREENIGHYTWLFAALRKTSNTPRSIDTKAKFTVHFVLSRLTRSSEWREWWFSYFYFHFLRLTETRTRTHTH